VVHLSSTGCSALIYRPSPTALTLALPSWCRLQASGITSPRALAAALTARNIPTRSGRGSWSARTVRSLVARIKRLEP
jgi:hypothetical protein